MRDHASQGVSRSGHHTSQGVSCCDHHTSQGTISGGHYTSQGVSSCGLSDWATSRGLYYDHPDDRWSKRQQDLLDQSLLEEMGSDDDWQYHKDTYNESQETIASVEDPNTIGGGGTPPPPPRPLPPVPPPPSCASAVAGPADAHEGDDQLRKPKKNRADANVSGARCHDGIMNRIKNMHESAEDCRVHTLQNLTVPVQARDPCRDVLNMIKNMGHEEDCTSQGNKSSVPRPSHRSACAIANHHLTSAPPPRLVFRGDERQPPQQLREEGRQPPQLLRGADQQPPPQPRGEYRQPPAVAQPPQPLRGADQQPPPHPQPPPPPPVACFDLEHFKHHVPILDHWNQHDIALQYFRHVARLVGDTSLRFDAADTCFMPKPETKRGRSYTFDHCSGADKRWCWHELVAQLDDASLQLVVEGSNRTPRGLVACMVYESTKIDNRRRSAAEKKTSNGKDKEVLYYWEFALLRDNGTVAFLRPDPNSTNVDYYEGLPTDDVPAVAARQWRLITGGTAHHRIKYFIHDGVPTFAIVHGLEEAATYNQAGVEFPSMSLLTLTPPQTLHFLHYRQPNNRLRGSATRPQHRASMKPRTV